MVNKVKKIISRLSLIFDARSYLYTCAVVAVLVIFAIQVFTIKNEYKVNVNIRDNISIDSQIVSKLKPNQVIEVFSKHDEWYIVKLSNSLGYISSGVVKVSSYQLFGLQFFSIEAIILFSFLLSLFTYLLLSNQLNSILENIAIRLHKDEQEKPVNKKQKRNTNYNWKNVFFGNVGETLVKKEVKRLMSSRKLLGYSQTKNLNINGSNFQIDFLVYTQTKGLLLLEVKFYGGRVKASKYPKWIQEINNETREMPNASLQVLRTKKYLHQLLERHKLNKWEIKPVVVFANKKSVIMAGKEGANIKPQSDVIILSMLETWIDGRKIDKNMLTTNDCKFLNTAIKQYEQEYSSNGSTNTGFAS